MNAVNGNIKYCRKLDVMYALHIEMFKKNSQLLCAEILNAGGK